MSTHKLSSQWFVRAAEMVILFEGKQPAQLIQNDLDNDDYDSLQHHVILAEAMASIEEFAPEPNEFLSAEDTY